MEPVQQEALDQLGSTNHCNSPPTKADMDEIPMIDPPCGV